MFSVSIVCSQVLCTILSLLDAKSLARLTCTCKYMNVFGWDAAPGLLLKLYPHQRSAVRWMLQHESRHNRKQSQAAAPWPVPILPSTHSMMSTVTQHAQHTSPAETAGVLTQPGKQQDVHSMCTQQESAVLPAELSEWLQQVTPSLVTPQEAAAKLETWFSQHPVFRELDLPDGRCMFANLVRCVPHHLSDPCSHP